jgi:hypothetical protein
MKRIYSQLRALDLIRSLADAGILSGDAPLDPVREDMLIRQVGGVVESSVFDLDCGHGAGYVLALHVATKLPRFRIWRWQLDLPWEDSQFQWLDDPAEYSSCDDMYQFPGCSALKYPRTEVINHRRELQRGRSLDGSLLGVGFESVPDSYCHGSAVNANLHLIDEMNRRLSTEVQLWVDRSARLRRKGGKATTKKRGDLFDKPDFAPREVVQS